MQKKVKTFLTKHTVELTNNELQIAILDAARMEHPSVPFRGAGPKVIFIEDAAGNTKVQIIWRELDRPVHVAKK